jgi:L-ascorbate metabolism protein UlaG (beta-lactamase superfamily)
VSIDSARLAYIGHATVGLRMNGVRLLTDPLVRRRVVHLYRYALPPDPQWLALPDAILLSHLHLDHCDIPSLRRIGSATRLIVPRGAGIVLTRHGFHAVEELAPGETTAVGTLSITATPAAHSGFRPPSGPTAIPLGYLISGSRRLYFAGDTDLFPEMADLATGLDVALLPVWGWGRSLGPGHLDPQRAAAALQLLRPRLAIPIHWGTYARVGLVGRMPTFLTEPPHLFVGEAARLAPHVPVRIVQPGEEIDLEFLA